MAADDASRIAWQPSADPAGWRPWVSDQSPHYGPDTGLRRRLGGRSLYWTGVALRLESWALDDWPAAVRADLELSWDGGPSLYDRVEADLSRWADASQATAVTGDVAGVRFSALHQAIRTVADGRWSAYSPLTEALADPDIRIVGDARVQSLRPEGDGIEVHLEGSPSESLLRCDAVCLAAGTLESTRIAAGVLGLSEFAGLNDHHIHGLLLPLSTTHDVDLAPGRLFYRPARSDQRWNTYARVRQDIGPGPVLDMWALGEQMPSETPSVIIVDPGSVEVRPRLSAVDVELIEQVWEWLAGIAQQLGVAVDPDPAGGHFGAAYAVQTALDHVEAGRVGLVSRPLGAVDHEAGTLAFGAVTEDDGELTRGSGIFVTGPATFPRSGSANPTLTILALAQRTATSIAQRVT